MGSSIKKSEAKAHPGFRIACGLFAVIAFCQIIAVGVSIAARTGETREVIRYVKSDPLIISVPTLPDARSSTPALKPRDIEELMATYTNSDDEQPSSARHLSQEKATSSSQPSLAVEKSIIIANPLVEKLVIEAKAEHVKGDIISALTKLEEASIIDPSEPAIFYGMAQLFEDMGNWDRATKNYEKLFTMGPGIGVYYHKAALKLTNGINPESPKQELFVIGNILRRVSDDKRTARLTIPIRSTPNGEFDPTLLEVKVHHYDLVDNKKIEPVPLSRAENIQSRWITPNPNWSTNEEFAESLYEIPETSSSDIHIFGDRKYFGYVAELYYKNELIDQQAFPRRLHAIHGKQNNAPGYNDLYDDFPLDEVLPDINPDNPLLPSMLPSY